MARYERSSAVGTKRARYRVCAVYKPEPRLPPSPFVTSVVLPVALPCAMARRTARVTDRQDAVRARQEKELVHGEPGEIRELRCGA